MKSVLSLNISLEQERVVLTTFAPIPVGFTEVRTSSSLGAGIACSGNIEFFIKNLEPKFARSPLRVYDRIQLLTTYW